MGDSVLTDNTMWGNVLTDNTMGGNVLTDNTMGDNPQDLKTYLLVL